MNVIAYYAPFFLTEPTSPVYSPIALLSPVYAPKSPQYIPSSPTAPALPTTDAYNDIIDSVENTFIKVGANL